jgi:hypothetical protein
MALTAIRNRVFHEDDEVIVDGHDFIDCRFERSTFVYSGGEFQFTRSPVFEARVDLRDAAARSVTFFTFINLDLESLRTHILKKPVH